MIRDMELLLNKVHNDEIKLYMKEAYNCYNVEAYRACVIMAMNSGMYDLHNKLKDLAPSNCDIAILEDEISKLKHELKPYERTMIERCSTSKIDLLSSSEAKELMRCMDIRNSSAHPSDYNCTAESARYVFATIIDVLVSRPILFGQHHIKNLVKDINKELYFPRNDKSEIREIVNQQINLCSSRIVKPLAQKLVEEISNDKTLINSNKKFFLANMASKVGKEYDRVVTPLFIDKKYSDTIMVMLYANTDLVDKLSTENIKRLLCILPNYTDKSTYYNDAVISILLSERLGENDLDDNVVNMINYGYDSMTDNQCSIWLEIIESSFLSDRRKNVIIKNYRDCASLNSSFKSQKFQDILIKCNCEKLNDKFVYVIMDKIKQYDYTISNPAMEEFELLSEEFIEKLSNDSIEHIIYNIMYGAQGYGHLVKDYFKEITTKYVFDIFCERIIPTYSENNLIKLLQLSVKDDTVIKLLDDVKIKDNKFPSTFINLLKEHMKSLTSIDPWHLTVFRNIISGYKVDSSNND